MVINGVEHIVTLSVGIALARSHKTPVEELLRDADAAMYQAKEDGRARVSLFAQAMRAKARYRVDTEVELRRGLRVGRTPGVLPTRRRRRHR